METKEILEDQEKKAILEELMERVRKMEKGDDLSICSDEVVENLIIENRLLLDECEELMEREEEDVKSGGLRESKLGETMTSLGDSFIETLYEASKSIPQKAKRLIPTYKAEKERHWDYDTKILQETWQKTQGKAQINRQNKKKGQTTQESRPTTRTKQKLTKEEEQKERKRKEGKKSKKQLATEHALNRKMIDAFQTMGKIIKNKKTFHI